MRRNIVHQVECINAMRAARHLFDLNIYEIILLQNIHVNIHSGTEGLLWKQKITFFSFSVVNTVEKALFIKIYCMITINNIIHTWIKRELKNQDTIKINLVTIKHIYSHECNKHKYICSSLLVFLSLIIRALLWWHRFTWSTAVSHIIFLSLMLEDLLIWKTCKRNLLGIGIRNTK